MSRHDPSVSLRHMRDHAHELVDITRGRSRADLDTDRLLALAFVRCSREHFGASHMKIDRHKPVYQDLSVPASTWPLQSKHLSLTPGTRLGV